MKRFSGEISLGLATAAIIMMLWSWAHGEVSTLGQNLVLCISLLVFMTRNRPRAQAPGPAQISKSWPATPDEEMVRLLRQEQIIPAIKRHRELHGGSLSDAVDYVNAVRRDVIGT